MSMINDYLSLLSSAIAELPQDKIRDVIETLKAAYAQNKQVFLLGNGGSAMTASHMACDFQKGIKEITGIPFRAMSITDNVALMTAWANDTDYENIFAQQIDSLATPGDVVIAISGSGNSPNVLRAVERANAIGAITVGWSGFGGGKLATLAQKSIVVNSNNMQRVEDIHTVIGHIVFACMMKECAPGEKKD